MATQTEFRNYFEIREDIPWYEPGLFCCAYIDLKHMYLGEKIFGDNGISPLIVNRSETPNSRFVFIFCRVRRQDMGQFIKAMDRLKVQAALTVGSDYASFCRMFWDGLDSDEDMLEIFKPTWEQKKFSVVK